MLVRLIIKNYAIISDLDIQFSDDLTIITGETGAGKSILIGALSLVLGKRAETSVLYDSDDKCVVEAHFNIKDYGLITFFLENDLDYDSITILRREISSSGKSRAFVNDTPVNLSQIRELASHLIDIHSQHEVLSLKTAEFRARFIDSCSDRGKLYSEFKGDYQEWVSLKKQVEELNDKLAQSAADEDYIRFQLNELEELKLTEGELGTSQERLSFLENAEEINRTLASVSDALSLSETGVLDALRNIDSELRILSRKFGKAGEWQDRVHRSFIELEDLSRELENHGNGFDNDPLELQHLQERVDEILRLLVKHRKQSEAELIELQHEFASQLEGLNTSDEQLTLLLSELDAKGALLEKSAIALSELRAKTASKLVPRIETELREMGMPDARISIELTRTEITSLGQDRIEIKFTANKGQRLQDISKIASGGELSRLMLAVKSEIAKNAKLPAIIFDEIDTGVSGDVANRVGNKILKLSEWMQVFCITHSPQIASKANQHLLVHKKLVDGKTITSVRALSPEERIVEIAKMLSNANPTKTALTHAKNLINET